MRASNVKQGDWIVIKSNNITQGIDGYVFSVYSDEELSVGYYQNKEKAIKEDVVWRDGVWRFKSNGPSGAYLQGADADIVKQGPTKFL